MFLFVGSVAVGVVAGISVAGSVVANFVAGVIVTGDAVVAGVVADVLPWQNVLQFQFSI